MELIAADLRILNTATTPPFPIEDDAAVDEALRLRYRVHDLRRPLMQARLKTRHRLLQSVRAACSDMGLYEIETPILNRSTPEGARDFLVPSRIYPGSFYALPQSPQIIKQLLMVAGFDGYFQIARCFRDEDQRADRQLEFAQIDIERSFVGVDDVLQMLEELTVRAFRDVCGVELPHPFPRHGFADVMGRYGTDRPDTRFGLELVDLSDILVNSDFNVFAQAVRKGGIVKALPVPNAGAVSRSELDRLIERVQDWGAKGMAWIRVAADGTWQSPIAKYLDDAEQQQITERAGLRPGHLLLFIADRSALANDVLSRLRLDLGNRLGRGDGRAWDALFVVDFPLFEKADNGQLTYMHMPFVAPLEDDLDLLAADPLKVRATHYDLVINGIEMGSGSLRNHRSDVQLRILELLGYDEAEARERFGFCSTPLMPGRRRTAALRSASTVSACCWPAATACAMSSPFPRHSAPRTCSCNLPPKWTPANCVSSACGCNEAAMRCGFISIIGEPNAGKSTLLNTIIGTKLAIVTPKPQTTRHRILGVKNLPDAQLVFLDTPGIHRGKSRLSHFMMQAVDEALIDPQVVLYVTDANRSPYPDLAFLRRHLRQPDVAVFWLLNKTDRIEPSQLLPLIADYPGKDAFAEVMPLSALRGDNVGALVDCLVRYLPEGPPHFPPDMPTDRDERFLIAELIREQVMLRTHEEVPYAVAVEIEEFRERRDGGVEIDASVMVEKASQKGILVGRQGQMIKAIGTQARRAIGGLLHCPVRLHLVVRVRRNWKEHAGTLRTLGFGEMRAEGWRCTGVTPSCCAPTSSANPTRSWCCSRGISASCASWPVATAAATAAPPVIISP